jgi:hypothetical protein
MLGQVGSSAGSIHTRKDRKATARSKPCHLQSMRDLAARSFASRSAHAICTNGTRLMITRRCGSEGFACHQCLFDVAEAQFNGSDPSMIGGPPPSRSPAPTGASR